MGIPRVPIDPVQCIIPPHMIESIKMRGTKAQVNMAEEMERESAQFREERQARAPITAYKAAPSAAPETPSRPNREVYDCQNKTLLPGQLVRKEGDPETNDVQADEAFDGSGATYDLFFSEYNRDSIDGEGLKILSSVHYGNNYNNAFWNGEQMVYGDGDGIIFRPLTADLAVIGHELTHGVVQYSGGLVYRDQSGALNEHVADVFGVLTKQYRLGQGTCEADWLIGADILGSDINGEALRSMSAPGTAYDDDLLGKDPQPYHMDEYVYTNSDYGGVHINSGIPNHAFYLVSMILGGDAWEKAGKIWYEALQAINNPHARFSDWADETMEQARNLFGAGSHELIVTRRAWKLVGIV